MDNSIILLAGLGLFCMFLFVGGLIAHLIVSKREKTFRRYKV